MRLPLGSRRMHSSALLKTLSTTVFKSVTALNFKQFALIIYVLLISFNVKGQQSVKVIWPLNIDGEAVYTSGIASASFNYGPGLHSFKYDSVNGATAGGWDSRNLNNADYFEYKIVPERDETIIFNTLDFEVSLSTVNMRIAVHYSLDDFQTQSIPIGYEIFVGKKSSRDLHVETELAVTWPQTLSIRIYGWSALNPAVTFFAGNVEFEGVVKGKEEDSPVLNQDNEQPDRSTTTINSINLPAPSGNFIVPNNVYNLQVECWGGGGGGSNVVLSSAGGGGGGGAYATSTFAVTPGTSFPYTIGTGGNVGANGGSSIFNLGQIVAEGGKGGNSGGNGGAGGSASVSVGDFTSAGGKGGDMESALTSGGGGGAAGSSSGDGATGSNGAGGIGGAGGVGVNGAGNGGHGGNPNNAITVTTGAVPGGGGGGAGLNTNSRGGGAGRITVTYCISPTITLGPVQSVCFGSTSANLPYTATSETPNQYRIDYDAAAESAGFADVANTLLPSTPIVITLPANVAAATYTGTIYVSNADCSSIGNVFTITVKQLPVASVTNNLPVICSGSATNISLSSSLPGTTYSWSMSPVGVNNTPNGTGNPIIQTLTTTGAVTGTATYTVTPTAAGCAGLPVTTVVNVNPNPDVLITPNPQTICSGQSTAITLSSSVAGTTFSWTSTPVNVNGASGGSGNSIDQILSSNPSNVIGTVTYTITGSAASCTGTKNAVVTVNPVPTFSVSPTTQTVCPEEEIIPITISSSNGVTNTNYSWTRTNVPELSGIGLSGNSMPIGGAFSSTNPATMLTTTFTITATANGCSSSTTASVTVGDNIAPVVTCPVIGEQIVTTTSGCTYKHSGTPNWNASATDNCKVNNITYTLSGATNGSGSTLTDVVFNLGTTNITWTATDIAGNFSTCSFSVTVSDDDAPVYSFCPVNQNVNTSLDICAYNHAGISWDATATDNCSGSVTMTYVLSGVTTGTGSSLNGVSFNKGVTTVTWTATDVAGNSISLCVFTVTVVDNQPPVITCPGNQTRASNAGVCSYTVIGTEFDPLSIWDNCPGFTYKNTINGLASLAGATLNQGPNTITWTVTAVGGQTTSCSFVVTINDGQAPVLDCPDNIIEYTGAASGTCGKNVTWSLPTYTDNCPGAINLTSTHAPGSFFPVGTTTVTYTGTDGSNNSSTCSFTVTVVDDTKPLFTVPANTSVNTSSTCTYNIDPAITQFPTGVSDNCGILSTTYSDGPATPVGTCNGNFTVLRRWRVTDVNGNFTEKNQLITIQDKTAPLLTVPAPAIFDCADPVTAYGVATATDNCDANPSVIISSETITADPNCPSGKVITRTWTATDCSGNSVSKIQTITVDDNIKPVIVSSGNQTVRCPSQIPDPDISDISATDNCGSVTIEYLSTNAVFPAGATGFCPDTVFYYYKVTDQCGNFTIASQFIKVLEPLSKFCDCKLCSDTLSYHVIDFYGNPYGDTTITDVSRDSKCCSEVYHNNPSCISFSIRLDPGAVGLQIFVESGNPQQQQFLIDCGTMEFWDNGDIICLNGDQFYLFTYCKKGGNENNTFIFNSIAGIVIAPDITARVECNTQIEVNSSTQNVTWTSISPPGDWTGYLSCTNCTNPIFTPDANAPDVIQYKVCGTIEDMPCYGIGGSACDTITVYVRDSISVTFNVDPGAYCNDAIPQITATVVPSGTSYVLEWYKLPDLTTVLGTGYTFWPTSAGDYALKVHDTDNGVPCPDYYYYFTVAPDDQDPVIIPPVPLELECADPTITEQIDAWLAQATAEDDHSINIVVENDYSGIIQDCNNTITVTFTAKDECNNEGIATSTITIRDTQRPEWTTNVNELNRNVECSDALALEAAQGLLPVATDLCDDVTISKVSGGFVAGSCAQSGTITNTFSATDLCGNVTVTPYVQIISITDATPPTWTTLAGALNINVACNDVTGLAAAQALRPVATDICDPDVTISKISGSQVPGTCPTIYTITNTYTATDDCGNVSVVFTQIITVNDIVPPVINLQPSNLTVECDGSGNQTDLDNWLNNHGGATASDLCDNDLTWTHNFAGLSDDCGATGSATVVFTVADDCGNYISTNAVTFTIEDTQPPSITCPAEATAIVNPGTCEVTGVDLGMATATDNCTALADIEITNNAPVAFPAGVTIVTWTATDACGNSVTCEQTVTVEDDIPPTIKCPIDVTATAPAPDCKLQVPNIGYPELTDNCDISLLTLTWVKSGATTGGGTGDVNNTEFNVGVTLVTYTVTDSWGNTDTCSFTVTVDDEVPPTIINCYNEPIIVNNEPGECYANVIIQTPEAIDECGEQFSIINDYNNTSNASDQYPTGTTLVTWTITDESDNEVTCQVSVTVNDIETPVIVCPANIEGLITGNGCVLENFPVPDPQITENCTYTVTWEMTGATVGSGTGFVGGEDFNIGITYVSYTITDASGKIDECEFQVWIKNLDVPQFVATCPVDTVTATTDPDRCDALVAVPSPDITNPCNELYTISHNSPYSSNTLDASGIYPIGITSFNWTITDASGNITTCPQTVTVSDDQAPTLTCPDNVTVTAAPPDCEVPDVLLGSPIYSDNCGNPVLTWGMNGPGGATSGSGLITQTSFPVGVTVITYFVTDSTGNRVECQFTVTVRDEVPPTIISCPSDQTLNAEDGKCSVYVTIPSPEVDDDCGEIVSITHNSVYSTNPLDASGTYPEGIHLITWTFTDESGNKVQCNTTITVEDNQNPVIICPADVEQELINGDCELANVVIPNPAISDNCDIRSLSWIMTGATSGASDLTGLNYVSGETFNVGVTTVTYLLTDVNGNTGTCDFKVTIKDLTPAFVATCPADVTVPSEPTICGATVTVPTPGISNPCEELYTIENDSPYTEDDASGFYPVGITTVNWIIIDASGNITNCEQTITVTELPPTLLCPPSQVVDAEYEKNYNSTVILGVPTYGDNCEVVSLTWTSSSPTPGSSLPTGININTNTTFYVGVTTITYTVTDNKGNSTVCNFTITVLSEPVIECPDSISTTTDPGLCSAELNPDGPTLISGVEPITWTYTIRNEAGEIIGSGNTCTTANVTTCIGDFTFPVGVNTITWTATNVSGSVECTQLVTVVDDEPVTYTQPGPFTFCVLNIQEASWDGQYEPLTDIFPIRPDWYIVEAGSTELDLKGLDDNCCDDFNIEWTITFSNGHPSISGLGQPSQYDPDNNGTLNSILLWGTINHTDVIHDITYTVTDCNGNILPIISTTILIKPRPNVIKMNAP